MSKTFEWFVGIDWAAEAHALCLVDARGQVRGERTVAHTAVAVQEAVLWLCAQTGTEPDAITVGIETPRGVLVDTLIELGFCVYALIPSSWIGSATASAPRVPRMMRRMRMCSQMRCAPIGGRFARCGRMIR